MEHWVTITISESDEAFTMPIFDALVDQHPEVGPVMDRAAPDGPTHYTMGLDAGDAHDASAMAVDMFRRALNSCGAVDAAGTRIIDLHAEVAPGDERPESELQTA
jgi:hypothetical protein